MKHVHVELRIVFLIFAILFVIGCIRRRLPRLRVGSTIDQEMLLRELGIDRRGRHKRSGRKNNNNELEIFSFETVALATDYFSDANKLGEGGFGPVYKVVQMLQILIVT